MRQARLDLGSHLDLCADVLANEESEVSGREQLLLPEEMYIQHIDIFQ